MTDPVDYLGDIELALVSSPVVVEYHVLRSWTNTDDGYLRIRATLVNGDFLEAAEYFVLDEEKIETVDYRHQWMDAEKNTLRRAGIVHPIIRICRTFPITFTSAQTRRCSPVILWASSNCCAISKPNSPNDNR